MVAVMIGDCAGGTFTKLLRVSPLGQGAAPRPLPPAPLHAPFTTCSAHSRGGVGSPSSGLLSMDADTGDTRSRESGSSSLSPPQEAMLPLSPSSPSSFDNPTSPTSPGGSRQESKLCGVCGDVAKSNHFGGRSCDSCKAFFRRSVQNNNYVTFSCPYEKKCVIGKTSRKSCQYCRFKKCLAIGMEKSWVMSDEQRKEMMEQRMKKKQQEQKHVAPPLPCHSGAMEHNLDEFKLSSCMAEEIEKIEENYRTSYIANPYSSGTVAETSGVFQTWMQFCKKIGHFFSLFPDFNSLSGQDQSILLRTAMTSAGIIMGSVTLEAWIGRKITPGSQAPMIPKLSFDSIERLVPGELLYKVKTFFEKFKAICPDETMAKILILVSLYSPELSGLEDSARIQQLQDHYTHMLKCYIKFKYRNKAGLMFPKAIVSLADVRELAERSLEIEVNRAFSTDISMASSDSSSGGNDKSWKDSRGGAGSGGGGGNGRTETMPHNVADLSGDSGNGGSQTNHLTRSSNLSWDEGRRGSVHDNVLAMDGVQCDMRRDISDNQMQEMFQSMSQPVILDLFKILSTEFDIDAKSERGKIKFLRKHDSSYNDVLSSKGKIHDKADNNVVFFQESPIDIKEEKMDVESNERETLRLLEKVFDSVGPEELVLNNSMDPSMSSDIGLLEEQDVFHDNYSHASNEICFAYHDRGHHSEASNHTQTEHFPPSYYRSENNQIGKCATRGYLSSVRSSKNVKCNVTLADLSTNHSSLMGQYSSCSQHPRRSDSNLHVHLPSYYSSPSTLTESPISTNESVYSPQLVSPTPSAHVHTSPSPSSSPSVLSNGSSNSPHFGMGVASSPYSASNGFIGTMPLSPHSPAHTSPLGPQFPYNSGSIYLARPTPSPPSTVVASSTNFQAPPQSSVHKQIMALSIQSPESPQEHRACLVQTGDLIHAQSVTYSPHFTVESSVRSSDHHIYRSNQQHRNGCHQQLPEIHSRSVDAYSSSAFPATREVGFRHSPSTTLNISAYSNMLTPATLSPSPSAVSAHSSTNNSPENSSDAFCQSFFSSQLNLDDLSIVERGVLHTLFAHVCEKQQLEGELSDGMIPKDLLDKLQAELKGTT